jgi:AraC family transcriptional regulator
MANTQQNVALAFRDKGPSADARQFSAGAGYSLERVVMRGARSFDYGWTGGAHYLALHQIRLNDGEAALAGAKPVRRLDLRQRMTFSPIGAAINGWSSLAGGENSYTALFFEPNLAEKELERAVDATSARPLLYFSQRDLCDTLGKIDRALSAFEEPDALLTETLTLLAVLELERMLRGPGRTETMQSGRLSARQLKAVQDYIAAHIGQTITLGALAKVAGLSRYHFARAFAQSTGVPPVRFVQHQRITRAQGLLKQTDQGLEAIAAQVGFGGGRQLSTAFKRLVGVSPRDYRRIVQ